MKFKNLIRKLFIPAAALSISTPVMLGATEAVSAQTNGLTASDAVSWVKSYEGQGIDFDGAYGNQCVDLIKAYYNYLGETAPRGNANTYAYNALPDGWERIQGAEPQPGDILVYTGGAYGHVGIYTGENESYHQNWGGGYVQKVNGSYDFSGMGYWGVIRPDFTDNYETESDDEGESYSYSEDDDDVNATNTPEYTHSDNRTFPGGEREHHRLYGYDYGFRPERRPENRPPEER